MIKNKKIIQASMFILVLTVSISFVSAAFGISSSYSEGSPIKVSPGKDVDVVLGWLQNTGDKDLTLEIELLEGGEVVTLTNNNLDSFVVPAGSLDIEVNLRVSIPNNVAIGTEYTVKIRMKQTSTDGQGTVALTSSSTKSAPILVVEDVVQPEPEVPQGEGFNIIWVLLGILVIIALVFLVYFIKKNKDTSIKPVDNTKVK